MEQLLWPALGLAGWLVYSVALAASPHPEQLEQRGRMALALWISILGRLSFLRHRDAPGTLHLPLTGQPWWADGMMPLPQSEAPAAASAPPSPPKVIVTRSLLPAILILLCVGCLTPTDKAREQLTQALRLATSVQAKFKAQDATFQLKLVQTAGAREPAVRALAAYRDKRKAVEQKAQACQAIMDDAADQLLLSDRAAGVNAAHQAQLCAADLRTAVIKLFDGG